MLPNPNIHHSLRMVVLRQVGVAILLCSLFSATNSITDWWEQRPELHKFDSSCHKLFFSPHAPSIWWVFPSISNTDISHITALPYLPPRFTFSMLAAFSHFEMLDIYWPMYLFHFSLPAVQYPSPLHGHRWITRPGLAQLTEWCCSSENTPLPSYSNGLSAGCPLARRATQ